MRKKKATLLVVAESLDDIAIFAGILRREYEVRVVMDAGQALDFARGEARPDLILIGFTPPDLEGFDLCRRLKQDSSLSSIPIVFLTTKALAVDERLAFEIGAVDYIRQPVDPDVLRARVRVHLGSLSVASGHAESRYKEIFQTTLDSIAFIDALTGRIVDINPAMAERLEAPWASLIGRQVSELPALQRLMPSTNDLYNRRLGECIRHVEPAGTPGGHWRHLHVRFDLHREKDHTLIRLDIRDLTWLVAAKRKDAYSAGEPYATLAE